MKLSVIIVTKNRKGLLDRCIRSIIKQSKYPNELIIVDNNSSDGTKNFVTKIKKSAPFTIRHVIEQNTGYPFIYNRGIEESINPWVIFIDDDCVASSHWLREAERAIIHHAKAAVILGESDSLHTGNIFSLAIWFTIYRWKQTGITNTSVVDYEILDNKNIIYNKIFLTKHNLRYDQSRASWMHGAAEDADLGMQIWVNGGKAFHAPNMIVSHDDPTTLSAYFRKINNSVAAMVSFEDKWAKERLQVQSRLPKNNFLQTFVTFQRQYHIPALTQILVLLLLCATYIHMKLYYPYIRLVYRWHQRAS